MIPADLEAWFNTNGIDSSKSRQNVSGGCISEALRIDSPQGPLFVKFRQHAPPRFYEAEAEGLDYLHLACNLKVPEVIAYGDRFIVMNFIQPAPHAAHFWEELGHQLALLHACERDQFGFINDNYCGETRQVNTLDVDGHHFFAQCRLLFQARMAWDNGKLEAMDMKAIERICERLPRLIPEQPASLLHGDLWSGNVHVSPEGKPVFIDPAVYFGWAEIDLAMTRLFGGFPERFYQAYQEQRPLERGWEKRLPLYNLYPLLNHLNLFGSGYQASVRDILKRFS